MDSASLDLDGELLRAARACAEAKGHRIADVLEKALAEYVETSQMSDDCAYTDGTAAESISAATKSREQIQELAGEPTYIFTFRVFPEEGWAIDPVPLIQFEGEQGLFTVACQFRGTQLVAKVYGRDVGDTWLDIKNEVRRAAMMIIDALGFANAAAPTLMAESFKLPERGFEDFNAAFDGLFDHDGVFHPELFLALVNFAGGGTPEGRAIAEALAEIRTAILEPEKTAVHSYRAIEAIRQTFVEQVDKGVDRKNSWKRLRAAVSISHTELEWLSDKSTPVRHGEIKPITYDERRRAISIARQVVRDIVGR